MILELLRIECRRLLGYDMLSEVEHVLVDLHVLNVIEVFIFGTLLV
jgi:hypothetical protein